MAFLDDEPTDMLITFKTIIQLKRCGYVMRLITTDENKNKTRKYQRLIEHLSNAYQG